MSALESLDGYLKQLERKMRLAAWTRGEPGGAGVAVW